TPAWPSLQIKQDKLSYMPPMMAPTAELTSLDGTFSLAKSFGDPAIPRGFSPYGIQTINGHIWVTYTALNKAQDGFVDIFDTEGNLVKHFASNGPLHSALGHHVGSR